MAAWVAACVPPSVRCTLSLTVDFTDDAVSFAFSAATSLTWLAFSAATSWACCFAAWTRGLPATLRAPAAICSYLSRPARAPRT